MVEVLNECVGCPTEMGCLGESCPNRRVEHHHCDGCGEETKLCSFDDGEYCRDCLAEMGIDDYSDLEVIE